MKILSAIFITLTVAGCATTKKKPSWVSESNKFAEEFTKDFSKISPELGSGLGYQEYDSLGSDPSEKTEQMEIALMKTWKSRLESKIKNTSSKDLRIDLEILLDNVTTDLRWKKVDEQLATIPFPQASKSVYSSLFQLINDQSPEKRKRAAVSRFKFYMSNLGKSNLVEAYLKEIERHEKKFANRKKFYPFVGEIERYLKDSPSYVEGVEELLKKSGRSDWQAEFTLFKKEVQKYDYFVRSQILPKSRKKPTYPREIYQLILKQSGVKTDPDEMIEVGKEEYKKLFARYSSLAKQIAVKYSLENDDPLSVLGHLKKNLISDPREAEKLYNSTSDRLEQIINTNNIVTLPSRKLKIRFAGEAESKANPVPHLNPPPLVNNKDILPEFVVPTSESGELPFDDFSFKSAAAILTAHEGRPGHDLQFSRMLEMPISLIRARFAANSVNIEGWAVFAEDLIYPYLTEEEKMIATQMRLWRIARYFLDPMVQLGYADKKKVINVFHDELGVSKVMAGLEYDRYAFESPGQATAYFQGLLNIRELKKDLFAKFGKQDERCFNDTLLSFGLLPHEKIRMFESDFRKCAQ